MEKLKNTKKKNLKKFIKEIKSKKWENRKMKKRNRK